MRRDLVLLLAALGMGAIGGYIMSQQYDGNVTTNPLSQNINLQDHDQFALNPFTTTTNSTSSIQKMEQELSQLQTRLNQLENRLNSQSIETVSNTEKQPSDAGTNENPGRSDPFTKESLVSAGVEEALAAEIIRRKSELEFKQLELRDRAIREKYINTPRYFQELRELNAASTSLKDDIGIDAYDRYLYESGQNNRVVVSSIMSGSPAEQSGLQKGDIIIRYDNEKIFNWNEIRQATSQGSRSEYISVDILRDGQLMNMVLPRGPLGVRLDSTRINPDH